MASPRTRTELLIPALFALVVSAWVAGVCVIPRGSVSPFSDLLSISVLAAFVFFAGWFAIRRSRSPLRRIKESLDYLTEGVAGRRLYIEDVRSPAGLIQLELNAYMDRLEEALARQRRFVGAVSHDIRTPLTIIKGDIEVALMKRRTPEEYEEVLRSNLEEVERIQGLVEDLVTLARTDYGELGVDLRRVNLSSVLAEVKEGFMELAARRGLELSSYLEPEVWVEGDESRLRQLFHNLVENALNYTPPGGKVQVALFSDPAREEALVRVKDTGVGISPRDLPHIFEPFYRGTHSRRTRHHGYGLGLAICDHIIKAHKGKILVDSREGPDSGTTFTVRLPRAKSHPRGEREKDFIPF